MTNNTVAYGRLEEFLVELGFSHKCVKKSHHWLEHAKSGSVLVFRPYQPGDSVSEADLVTTRVTLDENGLMPKEDFENWLHEPCAA